MSIKKKILQFLPVYRCKDAIMDELSNMNRTISTIETRLAELDYKNEYLF